MMSKLTIRSEPLGTVLIIGSWNFPLSLTLQPLISAIAAGCTAIVKPSEVSLHTCRLLKELLPLYLDKVAFPVIYADGGQTAQLLKHHPFDLVFYTGSSRVGTGSFFLIFKFKFRRNNDVTVRKMIEIILIEKFFHQKSKIES